MFRRRIGADAQWASTLGYRVALHATLACGAFVPALAQAASLPQNPVTGWSSGVPAYISMYEYVPAKLAASPAIVVAAHYCGGSASEFFGFAGMPAMEAAADKYGFIIVFPQTTNPASSAKCWDVGSSASLKHDGGGDTQAIAQMVKYEISTRGADAGRVYIMGASSGAMLTEAMLAVYPDVFKAGAEFSGVPAGCWSDGWSAASNWGGVCANGMDIMSAQQWGDLARGMDPGYSGARPRVQLWHGDNDQTIHFPNQGEAIKQWTNVLGLSATPSSSNTASGYTLQKWQNSCGFTVLEAHTQAGGGHTTPIDANSVISFFGLDKTGSDPESAACGGTGSGGGAGTGTGGGASGSIGNSRGGSTSGASGGAAGTGGGPTGSGGNPGDTITGGSGGLGQGTSGVGGAGLSGANGNPNAGAATSASGGGSPTADNSTGCSCEVAAGRGSAGVPSALALAALGAAFARRKRHGAQRAAGRTS